MVLAYLPTNILEDSTASSRWIVSTSTGGSPNRLQRVPQNVITIGQLGESSKWGIVAFQPGWYERGLKLQVRVTKAVVSKNYRFRSFAISIYMVLGHIKQWLLNWRSFSIRLHRINNRGASWSAVCCPRLSSKCGRIFPRNSLVFALLRAFCFCRFGSFHLYRSKLYSMVQVWTTPTRSFKTLTQNWSAIDTPGMDWFGSLAAQPVMAILVIASLSIRLSKNLLVKSGNVWKIVSQAQSLLSRAVSWQVLAASSVVRSAYSRPLGAPLGLLRAPGFTSDEY